MKVNIQHLILFDLTLHLNWWNLTKKETQRIALRKMPVVRIKQDKMLFKFILPNHILRNFLALHYKTVWIMVKESVLDSFWIVLSVLDGFWIMRIVLDSLQICSVDWIVLVCGFYCLLVCSACWARILKHFERKFSWKCLYRVSD